MIRLSLLSPGNTRQNRTTYIHIETRDLRGRSLCWCMPPYKESWMGNKGLGDAEGSRAPPPGLLTYPGSGACIRKVVASFLEQTLVSIICVTLYFTYFARLGPEIGTIMGKREEYVFV